jgi:hypothetical protein
MIGLPMIKFDTFVTTFFHLPISYSTITERKQNARVMLHDISFLILRPSIRILKTRLDPFPGNDEIGMRHTCRLDLEAPSLELVLRVDLAVVLPSRCFRVASRDGLYVSCNQAGRSNGLTG